MTTDDDAARPALRVISGDATLEEIAALLAVIGARARRPRAEAEQLQSFGWNERVRGMRTPLPHGPGAWAGSGRPS